MTIEHCLKALAFAASMAAVAGCSSRASTLAAPAAPDVTVVTVHATSVPSTTELPGRTQPYLVAQVRARVDGIVLKRDFVEGAAVRRGQPLFEIDPAPFEAAMQGANAALEKAEANLASTAAQVRRYRPLVDINAVSKQDYDNAVAVQGQAEADVATAKAALAMARINLGYTRVTSPIAGRSGPAQVTQGALVQGNAATLLTTVQQIDPIYVDLTQSSVEGLRLRDDLASGKVSPNAAGPANVALTLEDGRAYPHKGTLQFSDISVDPGTGSVTVRAVVPNPDATLLPGMFVRAAIDEGQVGGVFLVPQQGIAHDAKGEATALVVGADGKAALRALHLRGTLGNQWIVDAGLIDGDRVIVAGMQRVKPGVLVRATQG